jgi:hypothetical protein
MYIIYLLIVYAIIHMYICDRLFQNQAFVGNVSLREINQQLQIFTIIPDFRFY